jgi:hypothetical protein
MRQGDEKTVRRVCCSDVIARTLVSPEARIVIYVGLGLRSIIINGKFEA